MFMSNNGSIDLVSLANFQSKELGTILALLEKGPTIVPKILTQLDASGPLGSEVKYWHDQAVVALNTIP
jgi:hypothetical protein